MFKRTVAALLLCFAFSATTYAAPKGDDSSFGPALRTISRIVHFVAHILDGGNEPTVPKP